MSPTPARRIQDDTMIRTDPSAVPSSRLSDLAEIVAARIRERIRQRTSGRIRALEVRQGERELSVHGFAASFHVWQLALAASQDALRGESGLKLDCRLQVEVCYAAGSQIAIG